SYSSQGSYGSHGSYSSSSVVTHVYASNAIPTSTVVAESTTGSGALHVAVPDGAVVWVNDSKTKSSGADRQYVSHGLKSGQSYTYRVKVQYERDGKTVTENKVATLTAGGEATLDFGAESAPAIAEDSDTSTKLTLLVPADAKVTLAGAETRQSGAEREFVTTRLAEGKVWEDYTVRVEVAVNGKTEVQERSINLRGGESQRLAFDFGGSKLAAN
ncbi:MAG: TIGR03000 domain-containing protein, partial [Planctomycetales bacterium]|nr:TIGR03000 domain-containing protein [Planctomycetales bacterium]